jgi:hypothetical protein
VGPAQTAQIARHHIGEIAGGVGRLLGHDTHRRSRDALSTTFPPLIY